MLFELRSTRGRIGITVAINIVMIGLWFRFEMPIAILPALLTPGWINLFAPKQGAPVSVSGKRLMFFCPRHRRSRLVDYRRCVCDSALDER